MDLSVVNTIFTVCMVVGFAIPLLNILLGWAGSLFDFSFDSDIEIDGIFPFNIMCLCLLLIVFGAVGKAMRALMTNVFLLVVCLLAALALGIAAYWLLYHFVIKKLRGKENIALAYETVAGMQADVTLRIAGEGVGTVSIKDATGGGFLSFRAKIDPELKLYIGEAIAQGEKVVITRVDQEEKICYVSTLEWQFSQSNAKGE